MGKPAQFKAQEFIEAIPGTGGIITAIARKAGCAWHTAKKYIDTYPTIKAAYEDECERILDLAEVKVISAIKKGDGQMIRYYLSTKGKRRGYSEKQEHAVSFDFNVNDWKRQREQRRQEMDDVDELDDGASHDTES